jgi:hypothetical protein
MNDSSLLITLIMATFGVAIGIAMYQLYRAKKARREHHRSARTPDKVARRRL